MSRWPPGHGRGDTSADTEEEAAKHEQGNGKDSTITLQEEFRQRKVAFDFLVRNHGSARELDEALTALNAVRAALRAAAERGR